MMQFKLSVLLFPISYGWIVPRQERLLSSKLHSDLLEFKVQFADRKLNPQWEQREFWETHEIESLPTAAAEEDTTKAKTEEIEQPTKPREEAVIDPLEVERGEISFEEAELDEIETLDLPTQEIEAETTAATVNDIEPIDILLTTLELKEKKAEPMETAASPKTGTPDLATEDLEEETLVTVTSSEIESPALELDEVEEDTTLATSNEIESVNLSTQESKEKKEEILGAMSTDSEILDLAAQGLKEDKEEALMATTASAWIETPALGSEETTHEVETLDLTTQELEEEEKIKVVTDTPYTESDDPLAEPESGEETLITSELEETQNKIGPTLGEEETLLTTQTLLTTHKPDEPPSYATLEFEVQEEETVTAMSDVIGEEEEINAVYDKPLVTTAKPKAGEEDDSPTSIEVQEQKQQAVKETFPTYEDPATVWGALNDRFIMNELEGVSAKCRVYEAQLKDPNTGKPIGDECIIKVSTYHKLMRKEAENYHALQTKRDDLFIQVFEYHEPVNEGDVSAIIMEKGHIDIYKFMQKYGAFTGSGLQEVAKQVADILYHLHVDHELVWTELKSGNFVMTGNDSLKAIDVESAIPQDAPNVLYTATYAPPEFAMEDLCGRNMLMDFSFDIWSYGMLLYEIAMGELYVTTHKLDKNDRVRIFSKLKEQKMRSREHLDLGEKLEKNDKIDAGLKELIRQCLSIEPTDRPTIQEVVQHAYFDDYEPLDL